MPNVSKGVFSVIMGGLVTASRIILSVSPDPERLDKCHGGDYIL